MNIVCKSIFFFFLVWKGIVTFVSAVLLTKKRVVHYSKQPFNIHKTNFFVIITLP